MEAKLLSEKLRELRTDKGLTQEHIAQQLFVTRQTVSKWETGVNDPDLSTIVRLCDTYGVTLDYLLRDDAVLIHKLAHREKSYRKLVAWVVIASVAILALLMAISVGTVG